MFKLRRSFPSFARIDFIGLDLEKHPPTSIFHTYGKCGQNRKMVWHFYGKTKTAITSSKNQFRPQFWAQIVAGVETHPYSPFLGPGDNFRQSYEENQVQKIFRRDLPYDFGKSEIDICTRISHFAKRTVGFRPLRSLEDLPSAQNS